MTTERVIAPADRCPCGKPQDASSSGYCSYECYSKHEPAPASMGGPLSEADRLAEIRARLAATSPRGAGYDIGSIEAEAIRLTAADSDLQATAPADIAFLLELVGVLEGQLATAQEQFELERVAALIDPEAWRNVDPHSAEFFEELGARAEYEANFAEAVRQRREPSLAAAERVIALFEDSRALGLDGGGSDA